MQSLQHQWFSEENDRLRKGKRKYPHFDNKITYISKEFSSHIFEPSNVARHSFYPFISRPKKYRTYKNNKEGRRVFDPKKRPIAYAAHADAIIYSWYAFLLSHHYEKFLENEDIADCVIGYRKLQKKGSVEFARDAIREIQKRGDGVILCFDISGFFNNLDHQILKDGWCDILGHKRLSADHFALYKNITNYTQIDYDFVVDYFGIRKNEIKDMDKFCEPQDFRKMRKEFPEAFEYHNESFGIPQGSTISAVLSNIYMKDFDLSVYDKVVREKKGYYRRYSDDILIICKNGDEDEVIRFVKNSVKDVNLELSHDKTEIKHFFTKENNIEINDPINKHKNYFQYLGIAFDGSRAFVRHSSVARYQSKSARAIHKAANRSKRNKRSFPKKKILGKYSYSNSSNFLSYHKRVTDSFDEFAFIDQLPKHRVVKRLSKLIKKRMAD